MGSLPSMRTSELTTPALLVDASRLEGNLATMAEALPGRRLRPHVKAHKCTALAARQAAHGHRTFTCATTAEMEGMVRAGLGDDLLLANEVADASRLGALARQGARITLAVDSETTIDEAARARVPEVLIDVDVGLPRCGCRPDDAGRLSERARAAGLEVRGVMGYEGHIVGLEDRHTREAMLEESMALLKRASDDVGGDAISAGGTGTYDINTWATEIQAGSYVLMDTAYAKLGLPFVHALSVLATVISVSKDWAVADCGLKALGMDHGNPSVEGSEVWFCSDEHLTFVPGSPLRVGDRINVLPAHIDPTIAYHEHLHVVDGDDVVERWAVDLRGW
jgi:D-serine deaminase-like pyridoxal phosphate-dependent protein